MQKWLHGPLLACVCESSEPHPSTPQFDELKAAVGKAVKPKKAVVAHVHQPKLIAGGTPVTKVLSP